MVSLLASSRVEEQRESAAMDAIIWKTIKNNQSVVLNCQLTKEVRKHPYTMLMESEDA